MDSAQKYELEELIKELESYRGRHTELISVYVPAGTSLTQVSKQLEDEKGTATNIKSTSTRKNVIDALEKIIRQFKVIGQTPERGLVAFSGNISEKEGQQDLQIWTIEPPKILKTKLYRCDQTFLLDPLKEMVESDEVYGLLIIERKEATIGILEGKTIKILQTLTSGIPGKIKAGGQSAARFSRITENLAKEFFRRVSEEMKNQFFHMEKLKGILVGGPIPTKEEFLESGNLVTALKEKVLAVKDIGDTAMPGLKDLVNSSQEELAEQEIIKQKEILDEFFTTLAKEPKKAVYGEIETENKLNMGAVGKLIISKSLDREKIKYFESLASKTSAEVHLISEETTEGVQFENLSGVGGILRFAID